VAEGRLLAGANTNLGAAAATLTLDGGSLVMTNGFTTSRSVVLGSSGGTLDTTALGVLTSGTLSSVISGNGPLTIAANGDLNAPTGARLVFSGNNTFTGTVTITSGIVGPNSASAFGNASNVIVLDGGGLLGYLANTTVSNDIVLGASGGTFRVYGGGPSLLVNGTISGSGKLDITDNGPATLARANTFTGDTRIMASSPSNQSTLNLGHVDALSGSTLDLQASDRGCAQLDRGGK